MPTAWVTSGRNPAALENVQADLLARVRAYENGVPFIAANKCGTELGMVAYCGKSQIVDARGEIVALAGERDPQTLYAAIDLSPARMAPARSAPPKCPQPPPSTVRVAISIDPLPFDIDKRLELLDDIYALSPQSQGNAGLAAALSSAWVDDDTVLDPAGLVAYRRAGYALILWTTQLGVPWSQRIARARALELRLYVVVFDRSMRRAFAVDPDGTIVAGTFDEYRLASFAFDPLKPQRLQWRRVPMSPKASNASRPFATRSKHLDEWRRSSRRNAASKPRRLACGRDSRRSGCARNAIRSPPFYFGALREEPSHTRASACYRRIQLVRSEADPL